MEAGNINPSSKPYKISVPRRHLKHRRIKAESVPEKSFNNGGATMQKCIRNSEDVKSEDISGEYEQTAQFNVISCRIENQQAAEVADSHQADTGPKNLVDKPTSLATDPNTLDADQEDSYGLAFPDAEETIERRTNSENPFEGSRTSEQETYAQLEVEIKKLKEENSISCRNMQEISVSCQQLRRENHRLLKKLKKMCAPDTIAYLEARNPDKKVAANNVDTPSS